MQSTYTLNSSLCGDYAPFMTITRWTHPKAIALWTSDHAATLFTITLYLVHKFHNPNLILFKLTSICVKTR